MNALRRQFARDQVPCANGSSDRCHLLTGDVWVDTIHEQIVPGRTSTH